MAKHPFIDIFDLCWNAILEESKAFNNSIFNEKHCSNDETRDVNFDIVENRLAYVYKFGSFNALFVKNCLGSFLDNYSEGGKLFMRDDLKVCSLSNGPGLDLVGLLYGIYEYNQNFKNFPVLKAISLHNSWWNVCKTIFYNVFEAARASCNGSLAVPSEILHLMQSDIYSSISPDVKEFIQDSDILLIFKVFASTKATCDVVMKSMEEIFSILKPESFVFFIGSKKNTKELAANYSLSKFVDCILGPIKISISDIPVREAVVETVGIKPKDSGYSFFIVWQKKNSISLEEITKKKRRSKKRKSKIQEELTNSTTVSTKITDNIEECSDISSSSHSKNSEILSDEISSVSHENIFHPLSSNEINFQKLAKKEQHLSQKDLDFSLDSITSALNKIKIDPEIENLVEVEDKLELRRGSLCNLKGFIQDGEFENHEIKEVETKNLGDIFNETSVKQTVDVEMTLTGASLKQKAQSEKINNFCEKTDMKPVLTHQLDKEILIKYNDTNLLDKCNVSYKSSDEEKNVQATLTNTFVSDTKNTLDLRKIFLAKNIEIPAVVQSNIFCPPSKVKQTKKGKTTANQGLIKDICDKASVSNSSSRKNSIESIKSKNESRITLKKQSNENSHDFRTNRSSKEKKPEIDDRKKDLNSFLHRCESLVTSLEKLTANVKKSIALSNDHNSGCCNKELCAKLKIPHGCSNICRISTVHSNCCRKEYNCQSFHKTTNGLRHCHLEPK